MRQQTRYSLVILAAVVAGISVGHAASANIAVTTRDATWERWMQTFHLTDVDLVFNGANDVEQGNPVVGHLDTTSFQYAVGSADSGAGNLVAGEGGIELSSGQPFRQISIRQQPHLTFRALLVEVQTANGASGKETIIVDVGTQERAAPLVKTALLGGGVTQIAVLAYAGQAINSVTVSGVPIQAITEIRIAEGRPVSTAVADFNGDGYTDLLFYNAGTGGMVAWFMNGAAAVDGGYVTQAQTPPWAPVGVADFDGDGTPDILFQNPATGQLAVWLMRGLSPTSGAFIQPAQSADWRVVAVADFDQDGHPDILFQNAVTGELQVWFLDGTTVVSTAFVTPAQDPTWRCVGAADLDNDGSPDLLFQNRNTGQLAVWFMEGVDAVNGAYVTPAQDPAWVALAVGDFFGDGGHDVVFQNASTGLLAEWTLAGATVSGAASITPAQVPAWQLAGPR